MKTNHNILTVYSTFLLILSTSCTKTDFSDIPLVSVDVSKGQVCYLEDIAENIECYNLELPTDYYFGEIIDIRTHQDSTIIIPNKSIFSMHKGNTSTT